MKSGKKMSNGRAIAFGGTNGPKSFRQGKALNQGTSSNWQGKQANGSKLSTKAKDPC